MPDNTQHRYPVFIPWLLCGLVAFGIGIHFRLYPLAHDRSSDAYQQATMLVLNKVRNGIAAEVNAKLPAAPLSEREQRIQAGFNAALRTNKTMLNKAFDQVSLELLKKDPQHKRYLQESDSYYFLDLTRNILESGDVSATVDGSRYFNKKMLAPVGYWEPQTWHPYIGAWVYRAAKFFDPTIDLMAGLGFTPLVLFAFVLAAFFMACRSLGCGWPSAFTGSIFFILASIYLQRSTYAWYDNDAYSVLFPLLNLGLLSFALRPGNSLQKTLLWGLLAGVSFALYARFWTGWGSSWAVALATLALICLRSFILHEKNRLILAGLWATVALTPLLCLIAFIGIGQFLELIPFALGELKKFLLPAVNGWPDMFIIVGELHATSWREAVSLAGGWFMFLGAGLTLAALLRKSWAQRKSPPDALILLGAFAYITFLLALSAQRFTILLLTPVALIFAFGLEMLWQAAPGLASRSPLKTPVIQKLLLTAFLLLAMIPVYAAQRSIDTLMCPIFNSAWDRALTRLRESSPKDSVINTWWSPGHFVKAIADRRVTFDGASIKGEQAYWLTKVYLSRSENEALGILRMLNTSSNKAAEFLQRHGWPLSRAVPLLTQITALPRPAAAERLKKDLPPELAKELLDLTHGAPPPSYILIYQELVEGNVLLGYVGKWDFKKIEALNINAAALRRIPSKRSSRYIDFLWSLVGGPLRQSETLAPVGRKDALILFDQGVAVNTAEMSVKIDSGTFGRGIPRSLIYLDETAGRVTEKTFPDATLGYSVVFFHDRDHAPRAVLMDQSLANSLIVKLYYFDGKGLEHFRQFAKEQDITGRTKVFVYQVAWPKDF